MIETSQKKIDIYTKYLRKKLLDSGYERDYVNSLTNDQVLGESRKCCDCEEEVITKSQQMHTILEFDTPERISEVLAECLETVDELDELDEEECDCYEFSNDCDCGECSEDEGMLFNDDLFHSDIDTESEANETNTVIKKELEIINSKEIFDSAESIHEAMEMMYSFIVHLEDLRQDGYELIQPIEDGHGYLIR